MTSKTHRRTTLVAAALCAAVGAAPAMADHDHHSGRRIEPSASAGGSHHDYAKVTAVQPVYRTVRVSEPRRECREEPVTRYHSAGHGGHRSAVPLILGGILGGVAGNQFGGGSGNVALTVGGALLGGAIGGDLARQHHGYAGDRARRSYTDYQTRCETYTTSHEEERLDGYRVEYKYRGRVYSTHMDEHPGDRIRISVDVQPVRY